MMGIKEEMTLRNSRKMYFPLYMMIFILVGFLGYIYVNGLSVHKFLLMGIGLFIALTLTASETRRFKEAYTINKDFLAHSSGYISKDIKKILIESIIDIDVKQGIWQRLLRYGDIQVHAASGAHIIHMKNINKPHDFVKMLETRMNNKKYNDQSRI